MASQLATVPTRPIKVFTMSLDSFTSIRLAAQELPAAEPKLNILINNAGVMAFPRSTTEDGFETQFVVNHLGHFLLFQLLKPSLLAGASPTRPSRVVALSSTGHRMCPSPFPFDDIGFSKSEYSPFGAYGRSKLANVYFANELTRRYSSQNLHGLSLHPGSIVTPLQRHISDFPPPKGGGGILKDPEYTKQVKSVEQGAATTVWAAVGNDWAERGGVYLEDVGEAGLAKADVKRWGPGYSAAAFREEDEGELWRVSERLCGVGRGGVRGMESGPDHAHAWSEYKEGVRAYSAI